MQSVDTNKQHQNMNQNGVQIIYRKLLPNPSAQNIIQQQHQQINPQQYKFLQHQLSSQPNHPQEQNQPPHQNQVSFLHQLQYQQMSRQPQQDNNHFMNRPKSYQPAPTVVKYSPTNDTKQIINVNPVYNPSSSFHLRQQQLPPPLSMISPPMEKPSQANISLSKWQQIGQQPFVLPPVGAIEPPIYAMSSYLTDDRSLETPAPMPVECQLGTPDTPSPSLPSHSPPMDMSLDPAFFLMSQFEDEADRFPKKRRASTDAVNWSFKKRNRRTKAEITADNLAAIMRSLKPCRIILTPAEFKVEDMPVRAFVGSKIVVRKDLPRVHRMKLVPTNFIRISSIGFMRTKHGVAFSCMDQCKFKTYQPKKFQDHLQNHEKELQENQFKTCSVCRATIGRDSLLYELIHMLKVHLWTPQDILNLPIQEILYSTILNSSLKTETSDESDNESETTVVYSRCETPNIEPLEHISSECLQNSEKTEKNLCNDEEAGSTPDLPLEAVDEFIDEFEELANFQDDSTCTPLTTFDETDFKDPDYIPNDNIESEDEIVPDSVVTSDEDDLPSDANEPPSEEDEASSETRSETTKIATEDDSTDSELPLSSVNKRSAFIMSPPLQKQQLCTNVIEPTLPDSSFSSNRTKENDDEPKDEPVRDKMATTANEDKTNEVRTSPILLCMKTLKERKKIEMKKARVERRNRRNKRKIRKTYKRSESNESGKSKGSSRPYKKRRRIAIEPTYSESGSQETAEIKNHNNEQAKESTEHNCEIQNETLDERVPNNDEIEEQFPCDDTDQENRSCVKCNDFLNRIPLALMNKIKQSRIVAPTEQPNKEDIGDNKKSSDAIEEVSNQSTSAEQPDLPKSKIVILEDVILNSVENGDLSITNDARIAPIDPPFTRSRKKSKKHGLPTARKSTSKSSWGDQQNLFAKFNIKRCHVNLVNSDKRIKVIIENAKNEGVAGVSINSMFFADEVTGTPYQEEGSGIMNVSQSSDVLPKEIDYDEKEANETLHIKPPVAPTDFPAVLGLTMLDTQIDMIINEVESEKNETDDDFFDCENIDLPETPVTSEPDECPLVPVVESLLDKNVNMECATSDKDELTEKLVNLSELYPWIDDDIVEKWLKTESCAKAMLNDRYMFSTYKCMSISCAYFTTDIEKFEKHLDKHRKVDKHFICSFCLYDELEPEHLVQHIRKVHKHDLYQCSKCMYRSCEKFYCDVHRKKFHDSVKGINPILIYKSPKQDEITLKRRNRIEKCLDKKLENIVKPKQCKCKL